MATQNLLPPPYQDAIADLRKITPDGLPRAWVTDTWREFLRRIFNVVTALDAGKINLFALASQPVLTASNAGYVAFVSDYGHLVRWTGTAWEFAPGDPGNGFWSLRPIAPQEVGWQLCDGTVTNYLTVGAATLTTTTYTTPNVTAGTFLKVLTTYTGTIEAAIASAISGDTGSAAPSLSGSTATEATHTHAQGAHQHAISGVDQATAGVDVTVRAGATQIDIFADAGTGPGSAHSHNVGTLAVASHTHDEGTLETDTAARPP